MLYVTPNTRDRIRSLQFLAEERAHQRAEARAKRRLQALGKGRLQVLADRAARILDAGEPTKFEYEGACRQGFRSALVTEGWKWADADAASALIVATALHQIGAERPSWMDGQPESAANWSLERFYCARCGKPIPEERKMTKRGHTVKYCSSLCNDAASKARARIDGNRSTWAEHMAKSAARSEQTLRERSGDCEHCNRPFVTSRRDVRFCSPVCFSASRRKHVDKPCEQCGSTFSPNWSKQKGEQKYCSPVCYSASRRKRVDRPCEQCGSTFSPNWSKREGEQKYCSSACYTAAGRGSKTRERPEVVCKSCSTVFRPPASRTYCSPACNPRAPKAQRANFRCEETI